MRPGDHRLRRLRLLHVVEYPRQCRSRETRHGRADDLLDAHSSTLGPRAGAALGYAESADRGHPASVRHCARAMRCGDIAEAVRRLMSRGCCTKRVGEMNAPMAACRRSARALSKLPTISTRSTSSTASGAGATDCRIVPPTAERVERMLRHTSRAPDDIVATIAPASARPRSSASRSTPCWPVAIPSICRC